MERKGRVIAVSGKGGTGKTLISTLLIRYLSEEGIRAILAIDADPDSNLAEALGVEFERTVGDIREEFMELNLPAGSERKKYLESKAFEITVETDKFDLIVMGRPEGSGCYCAINHMLREIIDHTIEAYEFTVIDTEAGLEHLSRRTTQGVDIMVIVTDPSVKGFKTAERIKSLAENLELNFKRILLVVNRFDESNSNLRDILEKKARETGISEIHYIPEDPLVNEYDLQGKPVVDLPEDSKSYMAAKGLADSIIKDG
ncbi:MAG TPA: ATP-binding protein [Candidatus Altiarchaeales archaeon]|nr:ATP-binding protein [Candidatus Altiarchaeales archaeon]